MAGYFAGKDWPIQAVKSGDVLELGKRRIIFQETRMLHWPDSMVSYIPEEKLLISNDIFGQNIASTARFTDDFDDQGEFVRRIKEYYYNIVLPYSPTVLKALPVVESLDIDMIAPDHGLIHRGRDAVRWTVAMREPIAGGSVYWMDERADTGPIEAQDWCHVLPGEDAAALWRRALAPMGVHLLVQAVSRLVEGDTPRAVPQDERAATWEPAFTRQRLHA